MRKKPNNKLIGLFIISGIALFFAIIGMFISEKMMNKNKNLLVMYFSESIKGLDVGSQVVFKGVTVGKVVKIDIITDVEALNFSIPVYMAFDEDDSDISTEESIEDAKQVLQKLIEKGLRARLATQNYLTGQLMIELEFVKDAPEAKYHSAPGSDIPEIPTVLSQIAEISQGIQEIPLRETFKKLNTFLDKLNHDVVPQVEKLVADFSVVPNRTRNVPTTLNSFNQAMQNISVAAKTLGNFVDYLERHPEALIKGKGGY